MQQHYFHRFNISLLVKPWHRFPVASLGRGVNRRTACARIHQWEEAWPPELLLMFHIHSWQYIVLLFKWVSYLQKISVTLQFHLQRPSLRVPLKKIHQHLPFPDRKTIRSGRHLHMYILNCSFPFDELANVFINSTNGCVWSPSAYSGRS